MDERAEFEKWVASLPNCVGDDGACDGNLVGLDHEPHCPMFGKEDITFFDIWQAARAELRERNSALVEGIRKILAIADYRKTIRWMQKNDFIMDESLDTKRGKFVFVLYSNLGEITQEACHLLGIDFPGCPQCQSRNDCETHGWKFPELEALVPPDPQKEKDAPKT